jgi:hypothetical protein
MKLILAIILSIAYAAEFDIGAMTEKLRKKVGEDKGVTVRMVPPNIIIEGEVSVIERESLHKMIDKYQPKPPQIYSNLKIKSAELTMTAERMADRIAQKGVHVYYDNGVFVLSGHARSDRAAREAMEVAKTYAIDPQDSHALGAGKHDIIHNELK